MRLLALPGLAVVTLAGLAAHRSPVGTRPLPVHAGAVAGTVIVMDKGDKPAEDVGQAVIWLESEEAVFVEPVTVDMVTENKQFLPHILVIPVGSTVRFPNHDPFNHNVFSLSEGARFDLGLYGRGEGKSHQFDEAAVVRVYCNVHATMGGFVLVRNNAYFTQPGADGSFTIPDVPPGHYTLQAWHERAKTVTRAVYVTESGLNGVLVELDARGYKYKAHLNKNGQPYTQQGRRY